MHNISKHELQRTLLEILDTGGVYPSAGDVLTVQGAGEILWQTPAGDHGALAGLLDDDHTQYLLLAGRAGGQVAIGGTAASEDLTLQSTSHATRGHVIFGSAGTTVYDEVNDKFGIGTTAIPHGGIGIGKIAIDGPNASVDGPHIQITTAAQNYPLLQMMPWRLGDISLTIAAYYDGAGTWRASDNGSYFQFRARGDFSVRYDSGRGAGNPVTWQTGWALLTSGFFGVGILAPQTKLHIYDSNALTEPNVRIQQHSTGDCAIKFDLTRAGFLQQWCIGIDNSDSDKFKISRGTDVATTTVMTLQVDDQVGVGTSTPGTHLHVYDNDANVEPDLRVEQAGGGDAALRFLLTGGVSACIGIDNSTANDPLVVSLGADLATNPLVYMEGGAAGRIGVGAVPGAGSLLELTSTTLGFVLPRMTTAQRVALAAVNGMMVYDTTIGAIYGYEGGAWVNI